MSPWHLSTSRGRPMKFAASLTVTGLVGFLILEALKIVLAPVAAWLLAITVVAAKMLLVLLAAVSVLAALGVGVFVYRRMNRRSAEF